MGARRRWSLPNGSQGRRFGAEQEGLDSLIAQIEQLGGEAVSIVADVSDYDQSKPSEPCH